MDLSIIMPLYNNEGNVLSIYNKICDEFKGTLFEIIFVNNGSTDLTIDEIKNIYKNDNLHIKIINFSKKFNLESAIYAGILHSNSKYVAIYDINSNISLKYIFKMYDFIVKNEEYDSVCVNKVFNNQSLIKKVRNKIVNKLFSKDLSFEYSNCRILKKNMINTIKEISKSNGFNFNLVDNLGYNIYYYDIKSKDNNKYSILKNNKNKLLEYLGIFDLSFSLLYLLINIVLFIIKDNFNLDCLILFIILFSISIILFFLSKITNYLEEKNNKNIFVIKDTYGISDNYL